MGCVCGVHSNEDERQNLLVHNELVMEQQRDDGEKKLLLLGAGGSGKSTFFKQLQVIHGNGFPDRERVQFKKHVHHQVISQMKRLIERSFELSNGKYPDCAMTSDESVNAAHKMSYVREDLDVDEMIGEQIEILWGDDGIRKTFALRAQLAIYDSSQYFFDNIRRISAPNYIPTTEDILMVRHITTGVTERTFVIKQHTFRIVDVGGQRSERKKWIHCFDGVTAVIFVAALSGYDEVSYEDETQNVLLDSLNLFEEICNSPWFENTSMLLFLNKSDLFKQKISESNKNSGEGIRVTFPDYEGEVSSARDSLRFIRKLFEKRNRNESKRVYTHVTCAIDKQKVDRIFADVQHVVITNSLQRGALL